MSSNTGDQSKAIANAIANAHAAVADIIESLEIRHPVDEWYRRNERDAKAFHDLYNIGAHLRHLKARVMSEDNKS